MPRSGPHKFARVLKVCLDSELSSVASRSGSTRTGTQHNAVGPHHSISGSPSIPRSPLLSPKAPSPVPRATTDTTQTLRSIISIPALEHPQPERTVRLHDVSMRLLGQQTEPFTSAKVVTDSPVAISISPVTPARNRVLLVEDNAVNLKVCTRSPFSLARH